MQHSENTVAWTLYLWEAIMKKSKQAKTKQTTRKQATKPIKDRILLNKVANYFKDNPRNHFLYLFAIYSGLRISDILRLRWDDFYDFTAGCLREFITVTEGKTGKVREIPMNSDIIEAYAPFAAKFANQGGFVFKSQRSDNAICRSQAHRIISAAGKALGFRLSCHSLRKTCGYQLWKNGTAIETIMKMYNHTSLAVTFLYLDITQDEINEALLKLHLID